MIDLKDPSNKEGYQETLRSGKATEFWSVLQQALRDSIEHIQSQLDGEDIADLSPEQYKVQVEILKGRKKDLQKLLELPDTLIVWLESPDQTQPNLDPYNQPEDFMPADNSSTDSA